MILVSNSPPHPPVFCLYLEMVPPTLIGLHTATDILEVEATHSALLSQANNNSAKFELRGSTIFI